MDELGEYLNFLNASRSKLEALLGVLAFAPLLFAIISVSALGVDQEIARTGALWIVLASLSMVFMIHKISWIQDELSLFETCNTGAGRCHLCRLQLSIVRISKAANVRLFRVVLILEGISLALATLLWGFGDLLEGGTR